MAAEGGTEAYRHEAADLILPGGAPGRRLQMDSDAMARSGGSLLLYGTDRDTVPGPLVWRKDQRRAGLRTGRRPARQRVRRGFFLCDGVKLGRLPPPPG